MTSLEQLCLEGQRPEVTAVEALVPKVAPLSRLAELRIAGVAGAAAELAARLQSALPGVRVEVEQGAVCVCVQQPV